MKRKIISLLLVVCLGVALVACGTEEKTSSTSTSSQSEDSSSKLIKVGIINNDPNESGYRTANNNDLKAKFTKENGYDASFAYSLKNDEQIAAAQKLSLIHISEPTRP